ncbi:MAG: hypothetical protein M3R51_04295 [Candidatus Eremiobacteraeota bacterium]|nr:hypothetical protein [Candidatus Eremiobacteraeota bacterium]
MRVFLRKLPIAGLTILAVAMTGCGGAASSAGGDSGASVASQSVNVLPHYGAIPAVEKVMFLPAAQGGTVPAGTPAIVNDAAVISNAVNGVPCFNCVGNPVIAQAVGIPIPSAYIALHSVYEITYAFTNVSEPATSCTLTYTIKQGATSLLHHTSTISVNGDGTYVYAIAGPLPSNAVAGAATMTTNVDCSGFKPKPASEIVYFH